MPPGRRNREVFMLNTGRNREKGTRQRSGYRAYLSFVPAMLLCLALSGAAMAEEPAVEDSTPDVTYLSYIRCAADATVQMTARAIRENIFLSEGEAGWDFRAVEFASPKLALLFFPTPEQQGQIGQAFGSAGVETIRSMAKAINSQFSGDYAELADSLYQEGEFSYPDAEGVSMAIVLLFYDRNISCTMVKSNAEAASEEKKLGSVFLMSDQTVLPTVDESYLSQKMSALGLTGETEQVLYPESELDAIFSEGGYNSNAQTAIDAVTSSPDTYVRMAQEMLTGAAYAHNSYVDAQELADTYASAHEAEYAGPFEEIAAVRDLTEQAMAGDPDWTWKGISMSKEPYDGTLPQGESQDQGYQADKKILVITHDEDEEAGSISYDLESVLPPSNLPSSPEEADQIIYVDTTWDYSGENNGISIYDSKSRISLYDAKTMEKLGEIGSAFKTLTGVVMVSGNSYYAPVNYTDIKTLLINWAGGEAEGE